MPAAFLTVAAAGAPRAICGDATLPPRSPAPGTRSRAGTRRSPRKRPTPLEIVEVEIGSLLWVSFEPLTMHVIWRVDRFLVHGVWGPNVSGRSVPTALTCWPGACHANAGLLAAATSTWGQSSEKYDSAPLPAWMNRERLTVAAAASAATALPAEPSSASKTFQRGSPSAAPRNMEYLIRSRRVAENFGVDMSCLRYSQEWAADAIAATAEGLSDGRGRGALAMTWLHRSTAVCDAGIPVKHWMPAAVHFPPASKKLVGVPLTMHAAWVGMAATTISVAAEHQMSNSFRGAGGGGVGALRARGWRSQRCRATATPAM